MKFLKYILSAVALISFLPVLSADVNPDEIAGMRSQLASANSSADSIKILYNIYDATSQDKKAGVGDEILRIARRTNNQEVLIDILPQVAVLHTRSEEGLKSLLNDAERISDKEHRKGVKLFINVLRATREASFVPEADRNRILLKYAKADMIPTGDLYQDILDLYRVVIFMGKSTKSNLYLEYLVRLENLISKLPEDNRYLRNLYFTSAANIHTHNGNSRKAVEIDRMLLEIIDSLDKKYKSEGRKYRNYDRYRYICYRRMLSNYKALSSAEVKELYANCARIAEKDSEVNNDFYTIGYPTAYRLMAEKDYAAAVPALRKAIENNDHNATHMILLGMLVEAADSIHDNHTLLASLKEYNTLLERTLNQKSEEAYRELQIRYDVANLKNENTQLEIDKRDSEVATGQKLITIILAAMLLLAILLMILYRSHFSLRQKANSLKEENENLHNYIRELLDNGVPDGTVDLRNISSGPKSGKELK